jgi:hypothetical protein
VSEEESFDTFLQSQYRGGRSLRATLQLVQVGSCNALRSTIAKCGADRLLPRSIGFRTTLSADQEILWLDSLVRLLNTRAQPAGIMHRPRSLQRADRDGAAVAGRQACLQLDWSDLTLKCEARSMVRQNESGVAEIAERVG